MDVGTQDNPGADTPRRADRTRRVGRRRVILAVVCLVMGVLVSVAGVVSGWYSIEHRGRHRDTGLVEGALFIVFHYDGYHQTSSWQIKRTGGSFSWNGGRESFEPVGTGSIDLGVFRRMFIVYGDSALDGIVISLWFLAALFILPGTGLGFSAWHGIRRARIGLCVKCNYDLRGLPASAPCPECGKVRVVGVASVSQQ